MYSKAGRLLLGTKSHLMGESGAQLKGVSLVVKFPLFVGVSDAAQIWLA